MCLIIVFLLNLDDSALTYEHLHLFKLLLPCIQLLELVCLGQVEQQHVLLGVGLEICHEITHGFNVDVVITCDAAHVSRVNLLCSFVVADETCSIEFLHAVSHFLEKNHVAAWVHL